MKKLLLFFISAFVFQSASSQIQMPREATIPKEIAYQIKVTKDYFEGTITYSSSNFRIVTTKDECRFWWDWEISGLNPQTITSIRIIVNDTIVALPFTPEEYREYSRFRYVTKSFPQGEYSSSPVEVAEHWYYAEVTVDAALHIGLLKSIAADPEPNEAKISGNQWTVYTYSDWGKNSIRTMLDIYRQLTAESADQE